MRPLAAVVIVLVLVLAAATVGLLTVERQEAGGAASPEVAPAASPARAVRARPGKVLPVADAMKQLELIRPARPKLADDFTLAMQGGGSLRLAEQRGKVVLVNFWATWCPPCLEEMPAMERLYRQQRDAGFTLIAVSVDSDPKKVGPFVTEHRLSFPVALDPRMDVANTYGVRALPSTFVIGRDGSLAALAIGPRAWDNDAAHSLIEGLAH